MTDSIADNRRELVLAENADGLAARLADDTLALLAELQHSGRVPTLALTGGSLGIAMLEAMRRSQRCNDIDWSQVNLLWGDERWLPSGDAERNDRQADDALLGHVGVDPSRVHLVQSAGGDASLTDAAEAYTRVLRQLPQIDLVLLGIGPDGHVASLFPGHPAEHTAGVCAIPVDNSPKPPPERVSLSQAALCSAERVWLLAAGAAKHDAAKRAFPEFFADHAPDAEAVAAPELPAARMRGLVETRVYLDDSILGSDALSHKSH